MDQSSTKVLKTKDDHSDFISVHTNSGTFVDLKPLCLTRFWTMDDAVYLISLSSKMSSAPESFLTDLDLSAYADISMDFVLTVSPARCSEWNTVNENECLITGTCQVSDNESVSERLTSREKDIRDSHIAKFSTWCDLDNNDNDEEYHLCVFQAAQTQSRRYGLLSNGKTLPEECRLCIPTCSCLYRCPSVAEGVFVARCR